MGVRLCLQAVLESIMYHCVVHEKIGIEKFGSYPLLCVAKWILECHVLGGCTCVMFPALQNSMRRV